MFIETPRFPEAISYGSSGGPGYQTDIVTMNSGYEQRNGLWSAPIASYDVAHGLKSQDDLNELIAFFRVCKGRLNTFRFKDWSDYTVVSGEGVLVSLGGSNYQLYKRYTVGSNYEDRKIIKPVSGTVEFLPGITCTVNYTTGVITHTGGATPTSWIGEFDVPCRFDTDQMKVSMDYYNNFSWGQILLSEIRL